MYDLSENVGDYCRVNCSNRVWNYGVTWRWYTGCFEIYIGSDTTKLTNMRITGYRESRNESEMFIKNKTNIAS